MDDRAETPMQNFAGVRRRHLIADSSGPDGPEPLLSETMEKLD
jgi:hypothetical protein